MSGLIWVLSLLSAAVATGFGCLFVKGRHAMNRRHGDLHRQMKRTMRELKAQRHAHDQARRRVGLPPYRPPWRPGLWVSRQVFDYPLQIGFIVVGLGWFLSLPVHGNALPFAIAIMAAGLLQLGLIAFVIVRTLLDTTSWGRGRRLRAIREARRQERIEREAGVVFRPDPVRSD